MNTYKITFQRENGTTDSDRFTAATEAQARRDFKEVYRHGNGTITSVELVAENTPATKEQERKAIEKIRKIVAELGESSYVGTALEGCLEDAENNIENDFGDSMKRRLEYAEAQLKTAEERIAELKKNYSEGYAEWSEAAASDKETIMVLQERTLSAEDIDTFVALVLERRAGYDKELKNAAEYIVEMADDTDNTQFKNAVSNHRAAKRAKEKYDALAARLEKVRNIFLPHNDAK